MTRIPSRMKRIRPSSDRISSASSLRHPRAILPGDSIMWHFDNRQVPDIRTPLPGPNGGAMLARHNEFVSPSYTPAYPLFVERASGCVVQDADGNLFLDFTA